MQDVLLAVVLAVGLVFLGLTAADRGGQGLAGNARCAGAARAGASSSPRSCAGSTAEGDSLGAALGGVRHARPRGRRGDPRSTTCSACAGSSASVWPRPSTSWASSSATCGGCRAADGGSGRRSAEKLGMAGAVWAARDLAGARGRRARGPPPRREGAGGDGRAGRRAPLDPGAGEPNRWSTIRIADILTGMGRPVVEELMDAFPSMTVHGKLAAIDILGRMRSVEAVAWLRARLWNDPTGTCGRAPATRWAPSVTRTRVPR